MAAVECVLAAMSVAARGAAVAVATVRMWGDWKVYRASGAEVSSGGSTRVFRVLSSVACLLEYKIQARSAWIQVLRSQTSCITATAVRCACTNLMHIYMVSVLVIIM